MKYALPYHARVLAKSIASVICIFIDRSAHSPALFQNAKTQHLQQNAVQYNQQSISDILHTRSIMILLHYHKTADNPRIRFCTDTALLTVQRDVQNILTNHAPDIDSFTLQLHTHILICSKILII